jgi:hypothetical protein
MTTRNHPAFIEAIVQADDTADLLRSALLQANHKADAVGSLLVLPMLVEATKLVDQLRALRSALVNDATN